MSWWQSLDFTIFHWINDTGSNPVFDFLLPLWREKLMWLPLYLFLAVFAFQNLGSRKGGLFLVGLVLAVGLADFTSSTIVKKNVQRLRPCNNPETRELVVQRVHCGSGYSFTSSHAANHFAVAMYLSMFLGVLAPWVRPLVFTWAALVAYAQVYVGVHYPADVLFGAFLGAFLAWAVASLFRRLGWAPFFV